MPFCPNPDCPFIEKLGKPAEYSDGVIVCSDCGSPLTDEEIVPKPKRTRTFGNLDNRLLYAITALWFICGNLTWLLGAYLFGVGTFRLVVSTKRYMTAFHLYFTPASIAFMLYTITVAIIVFFITFLLSRATGKRKIWFIVFVVGAVGLPLYDTIHDNIVFVIRHQPLPSEANTILIQILTEAIIANLIITPLVAWLGVTLGNQYRMRKRT